MPRNASKPKKKLKTHRGAAKRFKVTASGKILRMHSGKRHLLGTKASGPHAQAEEADAGEQGRRGRRSADAALRLGMTYWLSVTILRRAKAHVVERSFSSRRVFNFSVTEVEM